MDAGAAPPANPWGAFHAAAKEVAPADSAPADPAASVEGKTEEPPAPSRPTLSQLLLKDQVRSLHTLYGLR